MHILKKKQSTFSILLLSFHTFYDFDVLFYIFMFILLLLIVVIITFTKYFFKFIYGCVGSSFLCEGFLQLQQVGTTLHHGAWASHYRGLSCCGAQAPDAQAQQLWLTGLVTPRHVGSSQTRARTRVPCIGRQTLNYCTTREALYKIFYWFLIYVLVYLNDLQFFYIFAFPIVFFPFLYRFLLLFY